MKKNLDMARQCGAVAIPAAIQTEPQGVVPMVVLFNDAQLDAFAERIRANQAAPLAKWPANKYDERQRAWCERYARETTFEPLMDEYETDEKTFAEAAVLSLDWFESWSSDAFHRAGRGNIPGGEMEMIDAALMAQA